MRELIEKFCEDRDIIFPQTKQEYVAVLTRMKNVGIVTEAEIENFLQRHK